MIALLLLLTACATENVPAPHATAPKDWLPAVADFKNEPNAPEPSDELLRILWKYAPDSFYIIYRNANLPAKVKFNGFDWTIKRTDEALHQSLQNNGSAQTSTKTAPDYRRWIFQTDPFKQVNELATATHEEKHRYTADSAVPLLAEATNGNGQLLRSAEYGDGRMTLYFSYYLERHRTRFNRLYPTFPVGEIASYITQASRSERFKIYVAGENPGQYLGIFSTLDEYNANYWSQRTMYDLYKYYQTELPLTADTWLAYFEGQTGGFLGWAEYRYFILTYLLYAKDNHPDVYQKLLADERFRATFTEIDDRYIELHKRVIARMTKELPAYLQAKGLKASLSIKRDPITGKITDCYLNIGNQGVGIFWAEYQATSQLLRTPAYLEMANQFRTTPAPELPPMEISQTN
jgi:hypothetical protein